MTDREAVINALNTAIDTAFAANCGLAKLPVDVAVRAVDMLKAQEPKKRESRAMLPCKCGCKRREHWFWCTPDNELCEELRCEKCGFTVTGKNQIDAIRRWNEAVKRE